MRFLDSRDLCPWSNFVAWKSSNQPSIDKQLLKSQVDVVSCCLTKEIRALQMELNKLARS